MSDRVGREGPCCSCRTPSGRRWAQGGAGGKRRGRRVPGRFCRCQAAPGDSTCTQVVASLSLIGEVGVRSRGSARACLWRGSLQEVSQPGRGMVQSESGWVWRSGLGQKCRGRRAGREWERMEERSSSLEQRGEAPSLGVPGAGARGRGGRRKSLSGPALALGFPAAPLLRTSQGLSPLRLAGGCEGLSGGGDQPAEGATARKGGALGTSRNQRLM